MRLPIGVVLAGVACVGLTACGHGKRLSDEDWKTIGKSVGESPTLRQFVIEKCLEAVPPAMSKDQSLAALMDVPSDRIRYEYCRRMTRDIAAGRLTRQDLDKAGPGSMSPAVVRALKKP